jgi:hypothetical protein
MKKLIYVVEFEVKNPIPAVLKKGRCYVAKVVGTSVEVGEFLIPIGVTGNDNFYSEIVELTPENVNNYKIHSRDKGLVSQFFNITVAVEKAALTQEEIVKETGDKFVRDMDKISEVDPVQIPGIIELVSHIASTCDDKYNEPMPAVDVYFLKYGQGKIPAGYNVGQAVGYLKRYLSEGYPKSYNPEDLLKAAHFLLFEIVRRKENP